MSEAKRKEYSYGCIVACRKADGDVFLLVRQPEHWGFPKGHAEGTETPVLAARRELNEECAIPNVELIPAQVFREQYSFVHGDVTIEKENMYFLGTVASSTCSPQEGEILECGFFPYEEARERLTHENAKRMLDEARAALAKYS